ncbi:MAG: glycosyltransferase [Sodaliphilus sp.]|nr:glycosyltransferase [Muribaculaceae bacterium]MCI6625905.1 glycosyltransferase [Bacteroidales bacterium]MDY5659229.1 glycosyltransferase [Sodaliphilus sp.]
MNKPRIFIAMHYMEIGGAETALVGLLNALDPARVDVDLFLYDHRGEMMQFIPEWVNLLPQIPKYSVLERPIVELVKRGFWDIAAARMSAKLIGKLTNVPSFSMDVFTSLFTNKLLPTICPQKKYDLAISFLTPHTYVKNKVVAKKKIAWIHTDYTIYPIAKNVERPIWCSYNYIASISNDVTRTFLQVFPTLAPKIMEIENILSPAFVRKRAELEDTDKEFRQTDKISLLSIGRYSEQKNYDNVPDICKRLINKTKLNIKWYIIGYGGDEALIRQKIKEAGMEEHVILLGKRSNPYPYIKACDIYVQPSRYEGKSVTVREAQMLCKPVVVTNYPTAPSQIRSGIDGVIVPMDNEGCAHGLAEVICDKSLQERIIAHLKTHDYGNESEVDKIYELIEK